MTTAFEYVESFLEIVQEDEEDRETYLQRVAFTIQNLPESGWNDLPTELQDWYNKTADMLADTDNEPEFDDIPGSDGEPEPVVKAVPKKAPKPVKAVEDSETEEKPEPKKRGRKPKAETEEGVAKEPKAPKEPKEPKGPVAANAVREILCENMSTTLDQLMEKLTERGVVMQRSSAQVVHLNTVRAFEVAIAQGTVSKDGKEVLTAA
jgi:hypothetical protein